MTPPDAAAAAAAADADADATAKETARVIQAATDAAAHAAAAAKAAAEAAMAAAAVVGTAPSQAGASESTWGPPTPIGYHAAQQSVGGIAAPLLAGFSFTMTSVLLTSSDHPLRWLNIALALFVGAGLVLIFAVQSAVWLQSLVAKPSDYMEWFPQMVSGNSPDPELITMQLEDFNKADTWATRTRWLYNLGILLLLAGITIAVVPPGNISHQRAVVIGIGIVGFFGEFVWVVWSWLRMKFPPKKKAGD